ncbi:major facilitator superfamily domain-containing protein [Neurospora hispaniola]|uniref:Major facilitator superfamily domain-containing protein n=1 Tax=Neurospora hispaniola TaxID=588809 RepID=A0AAJ0IEJ0_9PEZI|nr:major facilitator superfamily domain-containing protein [Neurospora hispaniola]
MIVIDACIELPCFQSASSEPHEAPVRPIAGHRSQPPAASKHNCLTDGLQQNHLFEDRISFICLILCDNRPIIGTSNRNIDKRSAYQVPSLQSLYHSTAAEQSSAAVNTKCPEPGYPTDFHIIRVTTKAVAESRPVRLCFNSSTPISNKLPPDPFPDCLDTQFVPRLPLAMPEITFQDEKNTISTTTSTSFGFLKDVTGVSSPASVYQVSITEELGGGGTKHASNYGSTPDHVFSDPAIAAYWADVYERAGYENRHRFDPSFEWGASEERKLVRKMDLRIVFWAWIMFCSLDLHRKNINRAISDDMLPELGMNTNDFNYGQTIFLAAFLLAELPSGLVAKKLGADRFVPMQIVSWSILSGAQVWITKRAHFYVIKALMGVAMGGFIPEIVLWLTYFYKSNELPLRLAFFWTALSTVNIAGSLMAAGILQMRGIRGWSGWQWLFLIEALMSLVVGIFAFVLMPPGPCQTKSWFRGKDGWFSEREEFILVNRLLRDDPSKGDMNNREGVSAKGLLKAIKEWEMWPLYIVGVCAYIPPGPPGEYLSLILRTHGFSVFQANLLTIPAYFLFACNLVILSYFSRRFKERGFIASLSQWWMLSFFAAIVALPDAGVWVRYALLIGILSYPYCHAILVAWTAENSNSVQTRAVSTALYIMFVQDGNIIYDNIYREDDKPLYKRGNKVLLAMVCLNIVLFYLTKAFYVWRNKAKEEKWKAMTSEEQRDYVLTTLDEGPKRLDFRFAH